MSDYENILNKISVSRLDNTPTGVKESYELRYQVYCEEVGFLPRSDYPEAFEQDHYDDTSVHLGCYFHYEDSKKMAGTVRLVHPENGKMPLLEHCEIYANFEHLFSHRRDVAEISRLCIDANFRRRKEDGLYATDVSASTEYKRRCHKPAFLLSLFKGIYQVSKLNGIKYWVIAVEPVLYNMLLKNHMPFTPIGPEVDYYGLVQPYVASVDSIEKSIFEGDVNYLRFLNQGLDVKDVCPLLKQ